MASTFVVFYQYSPDADERRGPYREDHLAWLREQADAGRISFAGATREPVDTGVLVVRAEDALEVRQLLLEDPYAKAPNLILNVTVRPIGIVIGG